MKNKIIDIKKALPAKLDYIGKWNVIDKDGWRILIDDKGNVYRQHRGKK